ncbi:hypothetical protein ACNKHS_07415 [Shigella flexneri]
MPTLAGIFYTTFFDNGFNDHRKDGGFAMLGLKVTWGLLSGWGLII